MKLVDLDYYNYIVNELRQKYLGEIKDDEKMTYFKTLFNIYSDICDALKACTCPTYTVIEAESDGWIKCSERLPDQGVNVILTFNDTYHIDPSWPEIQVLPAWRCNVGEDETPDGAWAIEGRLGGYSIPLEDGIAWKPLPKPYQE